MSIVDDASTSWNVRLVELEKQITRPEAEAVKLRVAISALSRSPEAQWPETQPPGGVFGEEAAARTARTEPGADPEAVTAEVKTASDVASATWIQRATMSTTLTNPPARDSSARPAGAPAAPAGALDGPERALV